MFRTFPFYRQLDAMDCGPTCLRMIAEYHGRSYALQTLREQSHADREGVSVRGIVLAAEAIGLQAMAVRLDFDQRAGAGLRQAPLPCIVHWEQNHFVVVYKVNDRHVWIADPRSGKIKLDREEFLRHWISDGQQGIAILLEPTPAFYQNASDTGGPSNYGLRYLLQFLRPYRRYFVQLVLGLLLASLFQIAFPFLTQAIVDVGIQNQDIDFIYLILIAQLALFAGQASVRILQDRLLLHISTRVNVSLVYQFLAKVMQLPLKYFDTKMVGDLLQRIGDHRRIEHFLVHSGLSFLFSAFTILVLSGVLLVYDGTIFLVFLGGSLAYVGWLLLFLRKRRTIDHARFHEAAENQNALIELIQGMREIKLQNSGHKRRWAWSGIQSRLFHANLKALQLEQTQETGANLISQLKDIFITFLTAMLAIEGQITLGMLLAVQFIIGQLNLPLQRLIRFIRTAQDARLSLERIGELQDLTSEDDNQPGALRELPQRSDIVIRDLHFRYNPLSELVLKGIDLELPAGSVTAIVGASGSGKTTLVKLLLGFYEPDRGQITLGDVPLSQIQKHTWRQACGAVLQDGFIFSDTIAENIAEGDSGPLDADRLAQATQVSNLSTFIQSLPLGHNTQIGAKGNGISQGQRQRILIARAVYKNPQFLFLDEATNALDANNEKAITHQFNTFFEGKTVLIVAHRLSTVKEADNIVVLERGRIVESGTHTELTRRRGAYYRLVKNQLELGT